MIYRNATIDDIEAVARLQQKYHVSTIDEKDKKDGFVTTLFTHEQFKEIIEKENGLAIACVVGVLVKVAFISIYDRGFT